MILVVGQNLAWQKVGHLPSLRRGEVNRLRSLREFASGKSVNVVRALRALGGEGEAVGYAGGAAGRRLEHDLRSEGLPCRLVHIVEDTRTCTTMAEPDGTCTEVIDPSSRVSDSEREEMRRTVAERLPLARLLIISGTTPEGETEDCYQHLVRAAHARRLPVMLDSSGLQARQALGESPEILKVNAHELADISGASCETGEQRVEACRRLAGAHGIRWFLITRGSAGIEAFDGTTLLHAVVPDVEVVNAIGSGDAAAAGAAWVILEAMGKDAASTEGVFSSPTVMREALLTAAAMGTANCLNPINGRVERADYLALRDRVRIEPSTTARG